MIVFIALLCLALAWLLNLGLLVYAAYILLAVLFLSHVLARSWIGGLEARRRVGENRVTAGATVPVELRIRNTGSVPIAWVLLEDLLPGAQPGIRGQGIEVRGRSVDISGLAAGGEHRMRYQVVTRKRGYYQLGPLIAESGDFFGLSRRYRVLQQPEYLLVLPRVIELEGYDLASRRPAGEIVMAHRLFEDPTRIVGIRDYQRGDELSRIHWRSTARTGTLQSKVYESSSVAGATLVLDFHVSSWETRDEPIRSDLAASCVASLANALASMNQQVGLISNGRDAADRIRTEGWRGDWRTRRQAAESAAMASTSTRLEPVVVPTRRLEGQFEKIHDALGRLEKSDGLEFPELIGNTVARMPRDATVIAVLGKVDLAIGVTLGELRRRGYAVTAIINAIDGETFGRWSAPLVAEGVAVRHLADTSSIRTICQRQVLRD